jgi:glycosyltransferase involved in cell wall biosynthesis
MASQGTGFTAVFDADFYVPQLDNQTVEKPSEHYQTIGHLAGLDPSPYVSTAWLRAHMGERPSDPLTAWLREWTELQLNPHPCIHLEAYLEENPDVAESGINPLVHWLMFGRAEGRLLLGSDLCAIPRSIGGDHIRSSAFASTSETRRQPRSVLFVLGSTAPSGGNHVIFQHAHHLEELGWRVELLATRDDESWGWHHLMDQLSFRRFEDLEYRSFDVAVATTWTTVFNLPHVSARYWAYFVQSVESRFFDRSVDQARASLAETTYGLNLPMVTVATWLSTYLAHVHCAPATTVINGIDKTLFVDHGDQLAHTNQGTIRVLVEGRVASSFKMVAEAVDAARGLPDIELWHVGGDPHNPLPGVHRTLPTMPQSAMPDVYRSCDALLRLSRVESFGLTPLEMFHCGGTAITSDVTGHEEYMIDGHNCLVVDTRDPHEAREALSRLTSDRDLLARLKANARSTAASWPDWETSSTRFAAFLDTLTRTGPEPSRSTVELTRQLGAQFKRATEHSHG